MRPFLGYEFGSQEVIKMIQGIYGLAIVVKDLDQAVKLYEAFFWR